MHTIISQMGRIQQTNERQTKKEKIEIDMYDFRY